MYNDLIDEETWAFIKRTNEFYPPDATDLTVKQQRQVYDNLCREFFAGYPDGVIVTDSKIQSSNHEIQIRIYSNQSSAPTAHVIYFHGGGYVVGSLDSHDDVCAEICDRTGFGVTSVDYRLAPEHIFPADFDDCLEIFQHVTAEIGLPIVMVGDSAGGNLAAAVSGASRALDEKPIGQVLIYPGLGADFSIGSFVEHANAPMLTLKDTIAYKNYRTGGDDTLLEDHRCIPLADNNFSGLPPTYIVSAQCDPLASDGETYRDKIIEAGGKAIWVNEQGLVHGYLRARHSVKRAKQSFDRIVDAISNLGNGDWPYG